MNLHQLLDLRVAQWIAANPRALPSQCTVLELLQWSATAPASQATSNRAEWVLQRLAAVVRAGHGVSVVPLASGFCADVAQHWMDDLEEPLLRGRGETPEEALEVVLEIWEERQDPEDDPQAMRVEDWPDRVLEAQRSLDLAELAAARLKSGVHYCATPGCPGLPYRASDRPHPCVAPWAGNPSARADRDPQPWAEPGLEDLCDAEK